MHARFRLVSAAAACAALAGLPAAANATAGQSTTPAHLPRYNHFASAAVVDLGTDDVDIVGGLARDHGTGTAYRWSVRNFDGSSWSDDGLGPGPFSLLDTVDAVSPDDIWAGGADSTGTLAVHFDGSTWQRVPTPVIAGAGDLSFTSISARTPSDVWGVGWCDIDEGPWVPVIEHWNGQHWRIVPGPADEPTGMLYGVAAVGANDAWAVGYGQQGGVIEHWDGHTWSVSRTRSWTFRAVTAIAPDDVWAAGTDTAGSAVAEHWDGSAWTDVPMRAVRAHETLYSLSGTSASDVWAVGNAGNGLYGMGAAVIQHWDGRTWHVVHAPITKGGAHVLTSVSALSADDAWAVGYLGEGYNGHALVLHWDGSAWTQQKVGK